jgi:hypothetical protein
MIPISTAVVLGLLIAIHSETALAQTTLVPSSYVADSYVAEENYLYCNPAPNVDKRHADFRPDLDHEPDIYPGLGLPSLLRLLCCSVSLRGAQPSKPRRAHDIGCFLRQNQSGDGRVANIGGFLAEPCAPGVEPLRRCRRIDEAR